MKKKDKRSIMQEFILNGGIPMKSKIVINNNHNVSVNANINNGMGMRGAFTVEDENMKSNSNVANKVLGALNMGSGGN